MSESSSLLNKYGISRTTETSSKRKLVTKGVDYLHLLAGGTVHFGSWRVLGVAGEHGAATITSATGQLLDIPHGNEGIEIDEVFEAPFTVDIQGMTSPDWILFAERFDG